MTKTVKTLIIVNVALFILINLASRFPWLAVFGLVPRYLWMKLWIWQLVTYMFVHAGLWHLAVNMLMLWFFGPAIENAWGPRRFLFYYFLTGLGAGACSVIAAFSSTMPVVGASGAIFGLLVAYAILFPETVILLFFIFPMKIKYAVLFLAAFNLLGALSQSGPGIAYVAHLGGGLCGYLYLKNEWLRYKFQAALSSKPKQGKKTPGNLNHQIDLILDKISKHGINSLSRKEKKILDSKSKEG